MRPVLGPHLCKSAPLLLSAQPLMQLQRNPNHPDAILAHVRSSTWYALSALQESSLQGCPVLGCRAEPVAGPSLPRQEGGTQLQAVLLPCCWFAAPLAGFHVPLCQHRFVMSPLTCVGGCVSPEALMASAHWESRSAPSALWLCLQPVFAAVEFFLIYVSVMSEQDFQFGSMLKSYLANTNSLLLTLSELGHFCFPHGSFGLFHVVVVLPAANTIFCFSQF